MKTILENTITAISKAISDKEIISFLYAKSGKKILVEPHMLGFHQDSNEQVLLAFECSFIQRRDDKRNWQLFDLRKISEVHECGIKIHPNRTGSEALTQDISEIICSV